jgi:hypothetical protein
MAKISSTLLLGVVVLVAVVLLSRSTNVIVQDNPVKFSSTRKHPFDVFSDPYHPPERENPYLFGRDYSYQQVGVLNGDAGLAPLFGRPSPRSSNLWEYYTMKEGLKLPVSVGTRPCSADKGCDELLSGPGESVNVLGLGQFTPFVYDTKQLRY